MSLDELKNYFKENMKKYENAFNNKDLNGILSYWTEDSELMTPATPMIAGKENIKQVVKTLLSTLEHWKYDLYDVYLLSDESAIVTGLITDKYKDADEKSVRSVVFWVKNPNGDWKGKHVVAVQ